VQPTFRKTLMLLRSGLLHDLQREDYLLRRYISLHLRLRSLSGTKLYQQYNQNETPLEDAGDKKYSHK
jgi:hypothetical protein